MGSLLALVGLFVLKEEALNLENLSRPELQVILFCVAGQEYCIEYAELLRVVAWDEFRPSSSPVRSLATSSDVDGGDLPLVELRKLMGLGSAKRTGESRVLLLASDTGPVGFVVESVGGIFQIPKDAIALRPREIQRAASELVQGVGRIEGRSFILLDVKALCLAANYDEQSGEDRIAPSRQIQ